MTRDGEVEHRGALPPGLPRISRHPGAVVDSVPLFREKQCRRSAPALLALRQPVAHIGEKYGIVSPDTKVAPFDVSTGSQR